MNKLTKGLLTLSLSAAIVGTAAACGGTDSDKWKGTTFTDYGTVVATQIHGGFVEETDKYVYFINGIGSTSSDNSFGTPIKGALVAADKTDLAKTEIVIPEMFTASDYSAGVYLFKESDGVYAYYGTPNTEKNSSGETSYSEMTFTKTRLDGKNSQKLFTVSSHSVEYRIAEADGTVYVVYYDSDNTALVSFNCATKKATTIIKTDEEVNDKTGEEYLSLDSYYFLDNGCGTQVIYTVTVYTQEYFEQQKTEDSSYSRQTAAYNYVYKYAVGSDAAVLLDGKTAQAKYSVKSVEGGYLFYTVTPISGKEATFAVKTSDLNTATKIDYPDNIKDGMIIKELDKVYYVDSDNKKVIENTLVKIGDVNEFKTRKTILKDVSLSTLINVDANYVYGIDGDGYIVAVERAGDKTIRISERTASTDWYSPEKVMIGDTEYMLYCDSSAIGNSYVYYADLSKLAAPKAEDTDDDGENDLFYLEGSFIGKKPASDRAAEVVATFGEINATLDAEKQSDGTYKDETVTKARAAYNALDDDAKKAVSDEDLAKLTNAEKALQLWAAFDKLANVRNYLNLNNDQKTALNNDYAAAKALAESFGDDFTTIRGYLTDNLNYLYQETASKLDASAS